MPCHASPAVTCHHALHKISRHYAPTNFLPVPFLGGKEKKKRKKRWVGKDSIIPSSAGHPSFVWKSSLKSPSSDQEQSPAVQQSPTQLSRWKAVLRDSTMSQAGAGGVSVALDWPLSLGATDRSASQVVVRNHLFLAFTDLNDI